MVKSKDVLPPLEEAGKRLLKSKTFWVAVVELASSTGAYFTGDITLETLVTAVVSGVAMVALRMVTKEPITRL